MIDTATSLSGDSPWKYNGIALKESLEEAA